MHQFYLWAALEAEGLGANLQHYNPIANQKTAETFGISQEWQLKAQLVFGDPQEGVREKLEPRKQTLPLEEKLTFYGL
jgi:predicted oxidoreductase (fatty acid repression mutant protein)